MESSDGEITAYLRGAGHLPEVSSEEEVELAKWIEAGVYAAHLRQQEGTKYTPEEEGEFDMLIQRGQEAKDVLIAAHIPLLVHIAKRYQFLDPTFKIQDLAQEGVFGLIHAAEKFDYKKGVPFVAYATWWIRKTMILGLAANNRGSQVSRDRYEKYMQFTIALKEIGHIGNNPIDWDDLLRALGSGWTKAMMADSLQLFEAIHRGSYDVEIGLFNDGLGTIGEVFGSLKSPTVEDIVTARVLVAQNPERVASVTAYLRKTLHPDLYEAFMARIGIEGRPLSNAETAQRVGVTPNTISRRFNHAREVVKRMLQDDSQFAEEVETLVVMSEYGNL